MSKQRRVRTGKLYIRPCELFGNLLSGIRARKPMNVNTNTFVQHIFSRYGSTLKRFFSTKSSPQKF